MKSTDTKQQQPATAKQTEQKPTLLTLPRGATLFLNPATNTYVSIS